jgi:hypothetical protein
MQLALPDSLNLSESDGSEPDVPANPFAVRREKSAKPNYQAANLLSAKSKKESSGAAGKDWNVGELQITTSYGFEMPMELHELQRSPIHFPNHTRNPGNVSSIEP